MYNTIWLNELVTVTIRSLINNIQYEMYYINLRSGLFKAKTIKTQCNLLKILAKSWEKDIILKFNFINFVSHSFGNLNYNIDQKSNSDMS